MVILFDDIIQKKETVLFQISKYLNLKYPIIDYYDGINVNYGGYRKINTIDSIFSIFGKSLRYLRLNKILHFIKHSYIIQKINLLNNKKIYYSMEDKEFIKNLKEIFREDVTLFVKLINKPELLKLWGFM